MRIAVTTDKKKKSLVTLLAELIYFQCPTEIVGSSSRRSAVLGVAHCVTCMTMPILSLSFRSKTHFLVWSIPSCVCSFVCQVTRLKSFYFYIDFSDTCTHR